MPKRQRTRVEGPGQARSSGGRSKKHAVKMEVMVTPTAEAVAQLPRALPRSAPQMCDTGKVAICGPGNSVGVRAAPHASAMVAPKASAPSVCNRRGVAMQRAREAQRRANAIALWDNKCCQCVDLEVPGAGEPGFDAHHMLRQMYKCYAYEIGCCDVTSISDCWTNHTGRRASAVASNQPSTCT